MGLFMFLFCRFQSTLYVHVDNTIERGYLKLKCRRGTQDSDLENMKRVGGNSREERAVI